MFDASDAPPPGEPGSATPALGPSGSAPSSGPPGGLGSQPPGRGYSTGWGWGSGWGGYPRRGGGLWFGVVLIVLGLYFLGLNLGWFSGVRWDIFWPVAIIVLGVLILLRRVR